MILRCKEPTIMSICRGTSLGHGGKNVCRWDEILNHFISKPVHYRGSVFQFPKEHNNCLQDFIFTTLHVARNPPSRYLTNTQANTQVKLQGNAGHVCFCKPTNADMNYVIFNGLIWSCVYKHEVDKGSGRSVNELTTETVKSQPFIQEEPPRIKPVTSRLNLMIRSQMIYPWFDYRALPGLFFNIRTSTYTRSPAYMNSTLSPVLSVHLCCVFNCNEAPWRKIVHIFSCLQVTYCMLFKNFQSVTFSFLFSLAHIYMALKNN